MLMVLKHKQKFDKTSRLNPNSDQKANLTPSTSRSGSKDKDKDKSKSNGNQNQQKKLDLTDKLGKDGKLTAQECQQHLDNGLCLLCSKSGCMVHSEQMSTLHSDHHYDYGPKSSPGVHGTCLEAAWSLSR